MAWSSSGWTIKPGVTFRVAFAWPYGEWVGAQFMQAKPLRYGLLGEYPNWHYPDQVMLFTFDQSIQFVRSTGYWYFVSIRNYGPDETVYTIYGGGVT